MEAALIVLDGWGLGDHDRLDAIRAAATPHFDHYRKSGAFGTLRTWGPSVGLPNGGMGNSEVGHLTIGAGRVVKQAHTRINEAITDGSFAANEVLESAFSVPREGGRVHLLGLASDAGVHADDAHLHALIELAAERDIEAVTHVFTDGRDTPPLAGRDYVAALESVVERHETGQIATVSGRYFAMDRDEHWDRTRLVYDAIVNREAKHTAPAAVDAVEAAYDRGETDEFIEPTVIEGGKPLEDGDSALCVNFRADRMRQLVRLLANINPEWPFEIDPPAVHVVTMTEYDQTFEVPVIFPTKEPEKTLGEVLAAAGKTQLRIAETEKYAHVTYFFNGGREVSYPGERREIVASPDVPTYDQQPEMSAPAVTDRAIDVTEADNPDVLILNYANPDMVGHTGDFEAAVAAVEAVDEELGRLLPVLLSSGAHVLITADHGNADDMGTPDRPHTAHTFNPVPFIYLAPDGSDGGRHVRDGGGLADIAPTLLALLGLDQPSVMTGTSLLAAGRTEKDV